MRFEAEMSLGEQRAVAETIALLFEHDPEYAVHDLLSTPHSGYRALHVWLRLPERVEVQVRAQLQGAWANLYEEAGDLFGRGIRYRGNPERPEDQAMVEELKRLSLADIAGMERDHDVLYREADDFHQYLNRVRNDSFSEWQALSRDVATIARLREFEQRKTTLYQVERDLYKRVQQFAHRLA